MVGPKAKEMLGPTASSISKDVKRVSGVLASDTLNAVALSVVVCEATQASGASLPLPPPVPSPSASLRPTSACSFHPQLT
ncbi:MAG: hypothetical protein SGPRY_005388 [Prymnesium sp.]